MIKLILPDGVVSEVAEGSCLLPLAQKYAKQYASPIVEGIVDGEPVDLQRPLYAGGEVKFIEVNTSEGMRVYTRTLLFLFLNAVHSMRPEMDIEVRNTLGSALYCEDKGKQKFTAEDIKNLEKHMRALVELHEPIHLNMYEKKKVMFFAERICTEDTLALLHSLPDDTMVTINYLAGVPGYLFGALAPDCSYVPYFELLPYDDGIVINYPDPGKWDYLPPFVDQPHINAAFQETQGWVTMIGCDTIGKLNKLIHAGKTQRIIQVAEALHEKKLVGIADMIAARRDKLKLILIAGPSSSGKTSTAQRLSIQLAVNGLEPLALSMDDYYVNRVDSPRNPDGSYDFECPEAIDLALFNDHMKRLLNGEKVELPKYNFQTGVREYRGNELQMNEKSVLIIEGIHGLNDKLTTSIPAENKLKIYVSALTPMSFDEFNRINTTDARLLRRIVRDNQFRGHDAVETLKRWDSVRDGETKYIFPFQDGADVIFNTTLIYELAVMKKYAKPLLEAVPKTEGKAYVTARRLLSLLSYVEEIDDTAIPMNSILREFVGGSAFKDAL